MINFKQQDEVLPSALNLFSIIVMVGALVFIWMPKSQTSSSVSASAARKVYVEISDAKTISRKVLHEVRPKLWEGNSETVAASVLGLLAKAAAADSVKLGAFRPQRSQQLADIIELPFTVQITGQYAGIRAVMRTLDSQGSKIALRSVQISASGEATHEVTASLNLSAYIPGEAINQAIEEANSNPDKARDRKVAHRPAASAARSGGGNHA